VLVAVVALLLGGSPSADLRITVRQNGREGPARTWTLRCDPPGGTLPRPAAACRRLAAFPDSPFAPTPPDVACSQIYGGPQEAFVRGRFRGRSVWARFSRRDGCAVERWNRIGFLLPARL
jgi:hypothetical protein